MAKVRLSAGREEVLFDDSAPLQGGTGKFSVAFRGVSLRTGEAVLVKHLRREPSGGDRYERLSALRHPALQRVVGLARHAGEPFLVMEYREGEDLKRYLSRHGRVREPHQALQWMLEVLGALSFLHDKRIVHADVKPSNLLVYEGYDGRRHMRLLDLDGVLFLDDLPRRRLPFAMIYAPPEQVLGFTQLVAPASDLYSLGVVLWEMLSGRRPYGGGHPSAIINLQLNAPLPRDRRIPGPLGEIIARATAKQPFPRPPAYYSREEIEKILAEGIAARYANAAEMQQALRRAR